MKTRRFMVIASLVVVSLLITTGVVVALGVGAVSQGTDSAAEGDFSTIGWGRNNNIPADGDFATIGGGENNAARRNHDTVSGGTDNIANGFSDEGGIRGFATVGGGQRNTANARSSTVSGGFDNTASGVFSTISGGAENTASGDHSTLGGGNFNTASGSDSTVSGGTLNTARGHAGAVAGGQNNEANGTAAAIGGGLLNTASGISSTIPGGESNFASGDYSFAAGFRAKANHKGAFVWADSTDEDFVSGGENEFLVRASGGLRFVTAINPERGVKLEPGSQEWLPIQSSDRNAKENFTPVDGHEVLELLRDIPIEKWNYKGQDSPILHIGPMGQDFHAAFGVGQDDKHIDTIDADGVALAAIQGLYEIVQEKDAEIAALEARIEALEESKDAETGLLPFNSSLMWMLAGGLGLLLVAPGLALVYCRLRSGE